MAKPTPKPTPKPKAGGKLDGKIGPIPKKAALGIGVGLFVLLFLYIRHRNSGASPATDTAALTDIAPTYSNVTPQQSASAGTPSPNTPITSQLDPETLSALGIGMPTDYVTATDLQSQLDTLGNNVASQIAQATLAPTNPPLVNHPAAKSGTKTVAKKAVATVRYYTYAPGKAPKGKKANELVLGKGQRVGFKSGKGYYAIG